MSTLGARLKQIRNELHLSQEAFGSKIGLTRAGIAAVEADNNKFSQDSLCRLLNTFDININYLLSGRGAPFNKENTPELKNKIMCEIESILTKYGIADSYQ